MTHLISPSLFNAPLLLTQPSPSFRFTPPVHPHKKNKSRTPRRDTVIKWNKKSNVENTLQIIEKLFSNGYHVILESPPGVGKSTLAKELAQKTHRNLYTLVLHDSLSEYDLVGSYRRHHQKYLLSTHPIHGKEQEIILKLIKYGGILHIDEGCIADSSSRVMDRLLPLFLGYKSFDIKEFLHAPRRIPVHSDFHILITQNPPYISKGVQPLSPSIQESCFLLTLKDNTEDSLKYFLLDYIKERDLLSLPSEYLSLLLKFYTQAQAFVSLSKRDLMRVIDHANFLFEKHSHLTPQKQRRLFMASLLSCLCLDQHSSDLIELFKTVMNLSSQDQEWLSHFLSQPFDIIDDVLSSSPYVLIRCSDGYGEELISFVCDKNNWDLSFF